MGKPTGFLEYERETAKVLPPKVRIANFKEFRTPLNKEKQKLQGARCMACGVPFCQSGMMIGGMASGCPLHNLVPETNYFKLPNFLRIFYFYSSFFPCLPCTL